MAARVRRDEPVRGLWRAVIWPVPLVAPVLAVILAVGIAFGVPRPPAGSGAGSGARVAATTLTVTEAIGRQSGSATVRGYVVGQPTAADSVVRRDFPGDTALALADSPGTATTSAMLYVQIPSGFRARFGLRSNPGLLGSRIDVSGALTAYFAHAGLKSVTAMTSAGSATAVPTVPTGPPGPTGPTLPTPAGTVGSAPVESYYSSAAGLTGDALKDELHRIISTGVIRLSYAQVWDALKVTDENPADTSDVLLLYSGTSVPKSENGDAPDEWNREHVWAKSHGDFGTAVGPGTDVHHLRPTDVSVNSTRGNKDFDDGGATVPEAPGNRTDADSWEPRAQDKGDVARMIFYMAVRYEGGDGAPDLEVDDAVSGGSAPRIGRLSALLRWHAQDPPDAFERRRNQLIHERFQHNRNPFIDHPEWATAVFG